MRPRSAASAHSAGELERLPESDATSPCRFFEPSSGRHHHTGDGHASIDGVLVLRKWAEEAPITLNTDTAIEDVVRLFQRLGLRHILFTSHGRLEGVLTKRDVWSIMRAEGSTSTRADLERERQGRTARRPGVERPGSGSVRESEDIRLLDGMSVASSVATVHR